MNFNPQVYYFPQISAHPHIIVSASQSSTNITLIHVFTAVGREQMCLDHQEGNGILAVNHH